MGTLGYTVAVILLGAYVRASGSGAGCGRSWPACQGEIIPRGAEGAQAVEFAHRLTSAFTGVLIIGLLVVVVRAFAVGHPARKAAWWSLFFVITEGLFGAALVRGELVADDASLARAIIVPTHLVNTFFLLASLGLVVWFTGGGDRPKLRADRRLAVMVVGSAIAMIVLAATGAVTALADTLFPSESLASGLTAEFDSTSELLTRLRIVHPILAVAVGVFTAWVVVVAGIRLGRGERPATAVLWLIGIQFVAGVLNVVFLTPIWLQLVHLLLADLLWISLIWFGADTLSDPRARFAALAESQA